MITGLVMWAKQVPHNWLRFSKKSGMGIQLTQTGDHYKQFLAEIEGGIKGVDS